MPRARRRSRAVAAIAALGLFIQTVAPIGVTAAQAGAKPSPSRQAAAPAKPATQAGAAPATAAAAAPHRRRWLAANLRLAERRDDPRLSAAGGELGQADALVAYSAVSQRAKSGEKPAIGTIKIEADTQVSVTERLVSFQKMKIVEANFQTLQKEQIREITTEIDKAIPDDERVIALDRVLANLDKSQVVPRNVEGVKADPPTIFFSTTPAVIMNLDGEPIWSPIKENDLKFAVNTNWDLFQYAPTNTLYLRNNDTWLKATDVKGDVVAGGQAARQLHEAAGGEENWKDVKANLPGKPVAASAVPKVFVSLQPAELILLTGAPAYRPVQGTGLQWVSNTESDVFRMGTTGAVYYLVAGRWFTAADFTGPWTFATPTLPADFKKIPLEHERSRVLASVPGTDQAIEAVLLAEIPQTARVNKKETKAPDVAYQGDAQFTPIEKTTVERAVNTDKDVFKVGDLYYMCYQGVWFVGKGASGPWQVAESVPEQIYQIPVSSPSHHVTYVTIEEDNDDDWVVYAAAAGYTGMMVAWGCTVWGSGWYYPPYWGYGGLYPYYYPHFPTYGYSAWYNPWTGRLRAERRRVWTVRRRWGRRAVQPAHRNLRARGRGLRSVRRARRRAGLQPSHRHLRADAAGLKRLWQLGLDLRAARR